MSKAELRPAYSWDCDECGREQFTRAIVPEMSDAERNELRSQYGIEEWETGNFQSMPHEVICECGAVFKTEAFEV